MNFKVTITQRALLELDEAYAWLAERSPQHAPPWHSRVLEAVDALEQFPSRCPRAPESKKGGDELRHLIVGDHVHAYRIIFAIRANQVIVLDIIHGARKV